MSQRVRFLNLSEPPSWSDSTLDHRIPARQRRYLAAPTATIYSPRQQCDRNFLQDPPNHSPKHNSNFGGDKSPPISALTVPSRIPADRGYGLGAFLTWSTHSKLTVDRITIRPMYLADTVCRGSPQIMSPRAWSSAAASLQPGLRTNVS